MKRAITFAIIIAAIVMIAAPSYARRGRVAPSMCFLLCDTARDVSYRHATANMTPFGVAQTPGWRQLGAHRRVKTAMREEHTSNASLGPRPYAWCGWYMRQYTGLRDPRLNLASAWASVGSNAGGPNVGVIVVWRHHVGKIVGRDDRTGLWIVHSGNDGHAVRTRPRSLAGAIAFRSI